MLERWQLLLGVRWSLLGSDPWSVWLAQECRFSSKIVVCARSESLWLPWRLSVRRAIFVTMVTLPVRSESLWLPWCLSVRSEPFWLPWWLSLWGASHCGYHGDSPCEERVIVVTMVTHPVSSESLWLPWWLALWAVSPCGYHGDSLCALFILTPFACITQNEQTIWPNI